MEQSMEAWEATMHVSKRLCASLTSDTDVKSRFYRKTQCMKVSDSLAELIGQGTTAVEYGCCNEDAVERAMTGYIDV